MKIRLTQWILFLSMLFSVGAMRTPANAQVVVRVGPTAHRTYYHHRYYHHRRYYHHSYRR
jgi:hypothetical protein